MQVFVMCPDLGLPAVAVTVGVNSVVSDVLTAAAAEWNVDPEEVELSFAGDTLCENERLADRGVGADSELEMGKKQFRIFDKSWFVDDIKRKKLVLWIRDHITEDLCLDTTTFSNDGCLDFQAELMPSDARQVSFCNSNFNGTAISSVTSIGKFFMSSYSQITTIDISCLSAVATIGDNFLSLCSQIATLDLSGLSSVTSIGSFFLYRCSQLTSLDLPGLSGIVTIGDYFLSRCSQITTVDLSGLNTITTVGDLFLSECSQITALDFSGVSSVTTIGNSFLSSCSRITALNLSGFSSVTSIGGFFLSECLQITSLDLSSLGSVNIIGRFFLGDCRALESVQFPRNNIALFKTSVEAATNHN